MHALNVINLEVIKLVPPFNNVIINSKIWNVFIRKVLSTVLWKIKYLFRLKIFANIVLQDINFSMLMHYFVSNVNILKPKSNVKLRISALGL